MDSQQIDAALSRLAVLKPPKDRRTMKPSPISRDDYHKLYNAADEKWRLRMLLMLNLCLHFEECLSLGWDDFNLNDGTFCSNREKRGRIIRAATLWPQTIALLTKVIKIQSPYVLISSRGTQFNAKGAWKSWQRLRKAAGLPLVQMDDIRDGAYSAACNAVGVDEKFSRLFAGHRSPGLQDNYVQRNPSIVRPACDAVYAAYFQ
jgi:integrase